MPENDEAFAQILDEYMNDIIDGIFAKSQMRLVEEHEKVFKSGSRKRVITTDKGTLLKTGNVNRDFLNKQITYPVPYASDVEYGNAGINPNESEIREWVRRKLLSGKDASEGKINAIARNISASLRARGQSPDPFLIPSVLEQIYEMERLQ